MSLLLKTPHTLKLTPLVFALSTSLALAETGPETRQAVPKVDTWHELSDYWASIEPELFTEAGSKKHLGEWVRFEGKLVSQGATLIVRLPSGTIARVTKVNKADRDFLAESRKPPPLAIVEGIIRALDRATHIVTLQAVDTRFGQ